MRTIVLVVAFLVLASGQTIPSEPSCDVERTAHIRFSSTSVDDILKVAVHGNPCWEGIATVSIARKSGDVLYRRDQRFMNLTVSQWNDPSLPAEAERFVKDTIKNGLVGNSSELPPWEGSGDDFYEKNATSLVVSPSHYESLRKRRLPVFHHQTYYEGGLDLVYDPLQKRVVIVLEGGL